MGAGYAKAGGGGDLNAYVAKIRPDGRIGFASGSPEWAGQQNVVNDRHEDMGADWDDVIVEQTSEVDTDPYGRQSTGGFLCGLFELADDARDGATAREMLISAALVWNSPRRIACKTVVCVTY